MIGHALGLQKGKDQVRLRSIGTLLVFGMLIVGCGGSDDPGTDPDQSGDASGSVTITIEDFTFSQPEELAVGGTVTVTNNDTTAHTWTSDDDLFNSSGIDPGGSFEFTFDEAGTYTFFCSIHPNMTGSITVSG
jgi:plastocyanin